jgi:hypothetical protein
MNFIELKTPGSTLINLSLIQKIVPISSGTQTRFYYTNTIYDDIAVAYDDVVAVVKNTVTG